jgi:cytochrome P450
MRFSPTRQEHKQHPFLWTPFGGGAHKCIGLHFADMLFKCVLFQVVKNFTVDFTHAGQSQDKVQYLPFPKPKNDLPVILAKI